MRWVGGEAAAAARRARRALQILLRECTSVGVFIKKVKKEKKVKKLKNVKKVETIFI